MKKRDQKKGTNAKRGHTWRVILIVGVCSALFAAGFFVAGRQHFASMDYGMKNSRLRKQIEELESQKRRLILAREISLSPNEIKKAAKKAGLFQTPEPLAPVDAAPAEPIRAASRPTTPTSPLVVKTASVATTRPIVTDAKQTERRERPDRAARILEAAPRESKRTVAAE